MKKELRKEILKKRDALSLTERKQKDILIRRRLFSMPEFKRAKRVLFYVSFGTEVETVGMIEESLQMGKKVVVPKVDKERRRLKLYEIRDIHELSPGYQGILEPSLPYGRLRDIGDIDLVIIPGVGFDCSGNRLGYGGGYFDILLSETKEKPPCIALAYREQIAGSLPSEFHDIKVDTVITDEVVIKVT